MADITMPQLGETVTEGTITRWAKQVGDRVEEDEVLFEVSTDKVDSEVPAPTSGYIAEILVNEGETVEVGAKLAVISEEAPSGNGSAAPAKDEKEEEKEEKEEPKAEEESKAEEEPKSEPEEPAAPEEPAVVSPKAESEAEPKPKSDGDGKVLSPVVRRLIAEHNLDPSQITGTGSGGRITRADVLALVEGKPKEAAAPAAKKDEAKAAAKDEAKEPAPEPVAARGHGDETIPFSNIRKRTAEHMIRSLSTSAHTLVATEVDYENVERTRVPIKDQFRSEEGVSLSYLPFIARAVIDAIREFPRVNATVGDNELVVHHFVNLGVAVDLNFEGLIVPVIHDADGKRLRALAREVADLANRARSKKLSADDISGGTFTITNAGGYGTLLTAPIINQPQVAILSTDGVKMKPVAVAVGDEDWAVAVHPVGNLAISFDHRAYDGAYAAAFLAKVREILETRDWQQEL